MSFQNSKNFNKIIELLKSSQFFLAKERLIDEEKNYSFDKEFYNLLGFVETQLNNTDDAEKNYLKSISIDNNFYDPKINLAILYYRTGKLIEAKDIFLDIIKKDPLNFQCNYNLGIICIDQKLYINAIEYLKNSTNINPSSYESYHQLGLAYEKKKEFSEAIKSYQTAEKLNINKFAFSLNNLGNIYSELKDYKKAVECLDKALNLNGDKSLIYNNLGVLYDEIGDLKKASYFWQKGIEYNKKNLVVRRRYVANLLYNLKDIQFYKKSATQYRDQIYSDLVNKKHKDVVFDLSLLKFKKKLRIGFVSGDFRRHPVGYFILDILKILKDNNLELFAYYNSDYEDDYTNFFKKDFNKFNKISFLSDKDLYKLILKDKIDILIDMSGYTGETRIPVFVMKPAPVQITWAAWLATTGIKEIDYIVGDLAATPKEHENHYVEKVLQLPNIWCHLSTSDIKNINTTQSPALVNNYITFGSFNHFHKMNETVIKTWSKILLSVPHSYLLLKNFQVNNFLYKKKIIDEFRKNGVLEERLFLETSSDRKDLLLTYNKIDIALDTFPYSGGTTSFETAWMGVPLLTMEGETFISRCGVSINNNLGQTTWIAKDVDQYIKMAIDYSRDFKKLDLVRSFLRDNARKSHLFDSLVFGNNFSDILKQVWLDFLENKKK